MSSDDPSERWNSPGLAPGDIANFKRTVDEFGKTPELPIHWQETVPPLLVYCWKRPPFLPPDWGFAIRTTISGRTLHYHITPAGKGYFHKKDMEAQEGLDVYADFPPMDGLSRPLYWVGPSESIALERRIYDASTLEVPAHWPEDTRVDTRRRVMWLPEDFGQGIKETITGGVLGCFICPDGKRFFHKSAMEKYIGYSFGEEHLNTNGKGDPYEGETALQQKRLEGYWTLVPPEEREGEEEAGGAAAAAAAPAEPAKPVESAAPAAVAAGPPARGAPAATATPPAKRPKLGYAMVQQGESWHVVPDDVLSVDVLGITSELEKAGWRRNEGCAEVASAKFSKQQAVGGVASDSALALGTLLLSSAGGALDISGVEGGEEGAARVARQYVEEWLLVGS